MSYDFDKVIDRRGTDSMKWNVGEDELPMWVADMDFETAPAVLDAIRRRTEHGIFGYTEVSDDWYDAYISWWRDRHHSVIRREELIFSTGVVPIISSVIRKITDPADHVAILTPVYNIFFNSIVNAGRIPEQVPLHYEPDRTYTLDLDRLEQTLADPKVSMLLFCNPHNPVGKIWDEKTIRWIAEASQKYGVTVISDEIHGDLTDPGKEYVSWLSLPEELTSNAIVCLAPTKAFNIAGLQTAGVVVRNAKLRYRVWRGLNNDEVAEPNAFAVTAAVAAFREGAEWLDALRSYLYENKQLVKRVLEQDVKELKLTESEATYLLWIDCERVETDSRKLAEFLRSETGLYLSHGSQFGMGGEHFLRLNIACPSVTLKEGLLRLDRGVQKYSEISGLQRR
ncbi:MAG: pyridoxal phosphate-dependent aminotransferase [Lachnospiraceae bacterium]|nr:pyridoxal phosphate-dependent aminotransferase [Lachnospiraceae bacterium]